MPALNWHGERRLGIHETRVTGALIAIGLSVWLLETDLDLDLRDWQSTLEGILTQGTGILLLAAVWLLLRVICLSPTPQRIECLERLPIVSVRQLFQFVIATALTLVALVESVKWSSFMFWIG